MRSILSSLTSLALVSACQQACPPVLDTNYEGDGFLVGQEIMHTAVIFYPACQIDQQHYWSSITTQNLGKGITVALHNLDYAAAIINSGRRFKLSKYRQDRFPYQGVYVLPVHIKYKDLHKDNPEVTFPSHCKTDWGTIITPYSRASMELDTLIFLPYTP
jgi:hypothetical protein